MMVNSMVVSLRKYKREKGKMKGGKPVIPAYSVSHIKASKQPLAHSKYAAMMLNR